MLLLLLLSLALLLWQLHAANVADRRHGRERRPLLIMDSLTTAPSAQGGSVDALSAVSVPPESDAIY